MPQKCKVCAHPQTQEIEQDIVNDVPHTHIGKKYDLDNQSVRYHSIHHLPEKLVRAVQHDKQEHTAGILDGIQTLLTRTERIMRDAESKGYGRLELEAINSAKGTYELLSKIAVKLREYQERDENREAGVINQQIQEGLQALSTTELKVYTQLQAKIFSASSDYEFSNEVQMFIESVESRGFDNISKDDKRWVDSPRNRPNQNKNSQKQGADPDDLDFEELEDLELDDLSDDTIPSSDSDPAWIKAERRRRS